MKRTGKTMPERTPKVLSASESSMPVFTSMAGSKIATAEDKMELPSRTEVMGTVELNKGLMRGRGAPSSFSRSAKKKKRAIIKETA